MTCLTYLTLNAQVLSEILKLSSIPALSPLSIPNTPLIFYKVLVILSRSLVSSEISLANIELMLIKVIL